MLCLSLFEEQLELSNEVLTTTQEEYAFNRACDLFFSIVKPIYLVSRDIEVGKQEVCLDDCLGIGYSNYKIYDIIDINYAKKLNIKVEPQDYDEAKLAIDYREDFRAVCRFIILETSKGNLDLLRTVGVEQNEIENSTYEEITNLLRVKYSTKHGSTLC